MALARIVTRYPEKAVSLSQALRAQGFQVEVANPDNGPLAPADLEIELETCDQHQVVELAAEIAGQLQADVVVFPGALVAPVAEVPIEFSAPEQPPVPAAVPEVEEAVMQSQYYVEEPVPAPQAPAYEVNLMSAGEEPAPARERSRALADWWSLCQLALRQRWSSIRAGCSSAVEATRLRTRELREKHRLRVAESRVTREQQLAEMQRLRAEAEERAAELARLRLAEAARLQELRQQQQLAEMQELQRQLAGQRRLEMELQRQEHTIIEENRPQPVAPAVVSGSPTGRRFAWLPRHLSPNLRGVVTGVAAVTVLFVVGLLLANFTPGKPLPATMTQGNSEQHTPFGATAAGQPSGSQGVTIRPASTSGGVVIGPALAPAKPRPAQVAAAPQAPPVRQARRHVSRAATETQDDEVADDVVVRHFTNFKKPAPTHQQAGLKRYSDMN